jgi:hypothetical protein
MPRRLGRAIRLNSRHFSRAAGAPVRRTVSKSCTPKRLGTLVRDALCRRRNRSLHWRIARVRECGLGADQAIYDARRRSLAQEQSRHRLGAEAQARRAAVATRQDRSASLAGRGLRRAGRRQLFLAHSRMALRAQVRGKLSPFAAAGRSRSRSDGARHFGGSPILGRHVSQDRARLRFRRRLG